MLREIKPKNARSARALAKRAPLSNENPKNTLFLKGTSTSSLLTSLITDLHSLKRPLAIRFTKKNPIHPFEDASSPEFFSQKNDTSLLCFGSHSKKRPHCMTFVRCFGGKILDMMECSVVQDTARTLAQFGGAKCKVGAKPLLSFSGPGFEALNEGSTAGNKFALAKSMFIDFFRGGSAKEMDVEGLQWMISFAASEEDAPEGGKKEVVRMRCWRIVTKRSGQKLPRVEVEEMGPRIDFRLGRVRDAEDAIMKEALKRVKGTDAKPKKNIETDHVGDKMGRIHLGRQDLDELQTRKMKGLKRRRDVEDKADPSDIEDLSGEEEDDDDMMSLIDVQSQSDDDGGVAVKRPRIE